jgi:hypothetical protein
MPALRLRLKLSGCADSPAAPPSQPLTGHNVPPSVRRDVARHLSELIHSWDAKKGYWPLLSLSTFRFPAALCLAFRLLLPMSFGRPATHFLWHRIVLCDNRSCLLDWNFRTVHIAHLIGFIFTEDGQYPIEQMRGTSTHGLFMMFPFVHHLVVVDCRHLWIEAPSNLGIQIRKLLDQIRTSLGDMQAFCLTVSASLYSQAPCHSTPGTRVLS